MRKYHGNVQFVPASGYEVYGESMDWNESCKDEVPEQTCGVAARRVQQCGYTGPKISLEDLEWKSVNGPFILVWFNNVPWSVEDVMPAPEAKVATSFPSFSLSLQNRNVHAGSSHLVL